MKNELAESRFEKTAHSDNTAAASQALSNEALSLTNLKTSERTPNHDVKSLPSLTITDDSKPGAKVQPENHSRDNGKDTKVEKGIEQGIPNKFDTATDVRKDPTVRHGSGEQKMGVPNKQVGTTEVSKHQSPEGYENRSESATNVKKESLEFSKQLSLSHSNDSNQSADETRIPAGKPEPLKTEQLRDNLTPSGKSGSYLVPAGRS